MNALPAPLFAACFTAWVESLREAQPDIVAVDGKTSRRSKAKGSDPPHLVSAWASRRRLVLGQEAVTETSNGINAIPVLLARLELESALVAIDAVGRQTEIAKAIRGKAPTISARSRTTGRPSPRRSAASSTTPRRRPRQPRDHRRRPRPHRGPPRRRQHDTGWLASDRRFPGAWRFPDLATIGMVEAEVERDNRTGIARRCHLSSARLPAQAFAAAVRPHWGVENRLPWVMDVLLGTTLHWSVL
jgi:predicted transposase YbfD/YdcC